MIGIFRNSVALLLICLYLAGVSFGQTAGKDKYWIFFKGKDLHENPQNFLSPKSLERRAKMGIAVDEKDFPISAQFIQALREAGFDLTGRQSKWLNGVSAWMDASEVAAVSQFPFVSAVKLIPKVQVDFAPVSGVATKYDPGYTSDQVTMLELEKLHQNGYMGQGILIAVMDNGFRDVDKNPYLTHLITGNRIVATRDFVNGGTDVYDQGSHGAAVLSILAGFDYEALDPTFSFVGSAPGASYILCHTENDFSETHQEEDNWVMAMEFADSIGADIFSTSLGYFSFDSGQGDYTYSQLDGNTTIITRASDLAASRGILVVNSAGNNGQGKLNAPADGDSVMAVAAVDEFEMIANFSSVGPSGDGRLKPDISAMGQATVYVRTDGTVSAGSGTSFSCPMMSGFAACLLQSKPSATNMELFDAILASGDRHSNPDTLYGHGIPNGPLAYQILHGTVFPGIPLQEDLNDYGVAMYPNPAWDRLHIIVQNLEEAFTAEMVVVDMAGRKLAAKEVQVGPFINHLMFYPQTDFPGIAQGVYAIRLVNRATEQVIFSGKLRLNEY